VIINVIDASQLARSLELTLELKDLQAPLVVCLNMMDEAARKGILIDSKALSIALGVPVVETIAARGQGILESFRAALALSRQRLQVRPEPFLYAPEAEDTVARLAQKLAGFTPQSDGRDGGGAAIEAGKQEPEGTASSAIATATAQAECVAAFPPARFEALQLVQSDPRTLAQLPDRLVAAAVSKAQDQITRLLGQPADAAISSARHAACLNLFERVARVTHPRRDWRERVDRLVMHPVWGYPVLVLVFLGIFQLIFTAGKFGEDRILGVFSSLIAWMSRYVAPQSVLFAAAKGALLGTAGAVAIVLPYLLPFLVCLAVLEDLGYLSRVGYLMDALMHRLGLHGTATLPVLLGYGCSVPAVMATRILSSRRDRFIAAFLAVLVP
jgi:ferrous iron transport protein B